MRASMKNGNTQSQHKDSTCNKIPVTESFLLKNIRLWIPKPVLKVIMKNEIIMKNSSNILTSPISAQDSSAMASTGILLDPMF